MTPKTSNQGMRNPQMGGVQSRLELTAPRPLCGHPEQWRLDAEHPWVCSVCHPPALKTWRVERRKVAPLEEDQAA